MKLTDIETITADLKIDKAQKTAIFKLIDLKTENDMDKFLTKIDSINSEIKRLEDKQDAKFGAMDTKFAMILWAIGLLMALIVTLKVIR